MVIYLFGHPEIEASNTLDLCELIFWRFSFLVCSRYMYFLQNKINFDTYLNDIDCPVWFECNNQMLLCNCMLELGLKLDITWAKERVRGFLKSTKFNSNQFATKNVLPSLRLRLISALVGINDAAFSQPLERIKLCEWFESSHMIEDKWSNHFNTGMLNDWQ